MTRPQVWLEHHHGYLAGHSVRRQIPLLVLRRITIAVGTWIIGLLPVSWTEGQANIARASNTMGLAFFIRMLNPASFAATSEGYQSTRTCPYRPIHSRTRT